jgi:LysM repeat protein
MSRPVAFAFLLALSAGLAAGPPAPAPGSCGGSHVVVRGDTLYSIARRCHSTVVAIAGASRLADPRRIEIGQLLVIPGAAQAPEPEPGKPEPPAAAAPASLVYNFQPGDTLYSLARWARVGVPALLAANPGINPHKVEIGDIVRLPAAAVAPAAARLREFGNGPGPALVRADMVMVPTAPPMRPRVEPPRLRPAPPSPPPRRPAKPDSEDERQPEGM